MKDLIRLWFRINLQAMRPGWLVGPQLGSKQARTMTRSAQNPGRREGKAIKMYSHRGERSVNRRKSLHYDGRSWLLDRWEGLHQTAELVSLTFSTAAASQKYQGPGNGKRTAGKNGGERQAETAKDS